MARLALAFFPVLLCLLAGCAEQEDIRRYSVPKPHAVDPGPDQLLGAIVLEGDRGWFFKMLDKREVVGPQEDAVRALVASLKFAADGTPAWTLPKGWTTKTGHPDRFATLGPSGSSAELSVTQLPRKNADEFMFIRANFDRWRNQLGLGPLDGSANQGSLSTIDLAGGEPAFAVNFRGKINTQAMPAMAGTGRMPPDAQHQPAQPASPGNSDVKYEAPPGWMPAPDPAGLRKVSLAVRDDGRKAELSVTSFPDNRPQIADPLANVNRWRREIGLGDTSEAELKGAVKGTAVAGRKASYVEMMGPPDAKPRKATLAAWFNAPGMVWFAKLSGDAQIVEAERANMAKFLESLRIE